MIQVTKLNGETIMVNADHIETVEAHPDTTLVLHNDKRIVIKDSVADVVRKVMEYQRDIRTGPRLGAGPRDPDEGTV
jgi:flagellar protein FlbD